MADIASALASIPADERSTWVSMAMAVKSELGDSGYPIWDQWSQTAHNYNARSAKAVWKSCKGTGLTIATLFHEAQTCGWKRTEPYTPPSQAQIEARRRDVEARQSIEGRERAKRGQQAAQKADWILGQCQMETHAYLQSKGWPELKGLVWRPDEETNLLCIPMLINGQLSSLQMIDRNGAKKFLTDGITAKAEFLLDAHGTDWWVEGWATGWSLKLCLQALKLPYRIHICFSANNLKRLAHSGFVAADNDTSKTGEKAAIDTGLPYWISEVEGEDINDLYRRVGLFKASQILRKWLQSQRVNQANGSI